MVPDRKEIEVEIYDLAKGCIEECIPKSKVLDDDVGNCLFDCFEKKIKKKS
jgi:hypothetical protein